MRRWNGWGNVDRDYPVPPSALDYLIQRLGQLNPVLDSTKETLLSTIAESRLPAHSLVDTSPETRLTHSRGQSLPDWIALRYGRVPVFPDGVAFPTTEAGVHNLMKYARNVGASVACLFLV